MNEITNQPPQEQMVVPETETQAVQHVDNMPIHSSEPIVGEKYDSVDYSGLDTFVFERTGDEIFIQPILPMLRMNVQRGYEKSKPKPPRQRVKMGNTEMWKENPTDKDYVQNLAEWNMNLGIAMITAVVSQGVILNDTQLEAVEAVRQQMADIGVPLSGNDAIVFVELVVGADDQEYLDLTQRISAISEPTEEVIKSEGEG